MNRVETILFDDGGKGYAVVDENDRIIDWVGFKYPDTTELVK